MCTIGMLLIMSMPWLGSWLSSRCFHMHWSWASWQAVNRPIFAGWRSTCPAMLSLVCQVDAFSPSVVVCESASHVHSLFWWLVVLEIAFGIHWLLACWKLIYYSLLNLVCHLDALLILQQEMVGYWSENRGSIYDVKWLDICSEERLRSSQSIVTVCCCKRNAALTDEWLI